MPVITMNVLCTITRRSGSDVYGQPTVSSVKNTRCAVVKFSTKRQKTTVRADSSGTRGHADEELAQIKVLLPKNTDVKLDDIFTLYGQDARVTVVSPRIDVMGRLDHIELEATIE